MLVQNILEAFRSIRANLLRAVLTILIIAVGITALIGVLTAIDGVKYWFSSSFVRIGANTFSIERYGSEVRGNGKRNRGPRPVIDYAQATNFKQEFSPIAPVSISARGTSAATAAYRSERTQNNILLMGGDENFIITGSYQIGTGRNITPADVRLYRSVILIGSEVAELLFKNRNPLGERIQVNGKSFEIIGVLAEIGSQGLVGGDKICVVPVTSLAASFPEQNRNFTIQVMVDDVEQMDNLTFEAVGAFRQIRGLAPSAENNFGIVKVEAILDNLMDNLRYLTWAATLIDISSLFSAAIGVMNIMLVSVTERTREIGVRKALGARKNTILLQFLTEAVLITQLGGLLGVGLGVLFGNVTSILLDTSFVVHWNWVAFVMLLCFAVGVIAGI